MNVKKFGVKAQKDLPEVQVVICPSFTYAFGRGVWECSEHESPVPVYKTELAAGADLFSTETHTLLPGDVADIPAGVALAIPEGFEGEIRGRSGYWFGQRILGFNGTIDADYRDEIKVSVINLGKNAVVIKPGFRIGQIVYKRVEQLDHEVVEELEPAESSRVGGLGSTGIVGKEPIE